MATYLDSLTFTASKTSADRILERFLESVFGENLTEDQFNKAQADILSVHGAFNLQTVKQYIDDEVQAEALRDWKPGRIESAAWNVIDRIKALFS